MLSDIALYQNIVLKHGPGAASAKKLVARHKSNRKFLRRAKMLDLLLKDKERVRRFLASHKREPA